MTGSRKKAIEQHCKSCIYDCYAPGSWRKQTEECTSFSCKLYPFRPTPAKTITQLVIVGSSSRIEPKIGVSNG